MAVAIWCFLITLSTLSLTPWMYDITTYPLHCFSLFLLHLPTSFLFNLSDQAGSPHTPSAFFKCYSSSLFSSSLVMIVWHLFNKILTTPNLCWTGWREVKCRYWPESAFCTLQMDSSVMLVKQASSKGRELSTSSSFVNMMQKPYHMTQAPLTSVVTSSWPGPEHYYNDVQSYLAVDVTFLPNLWRVYRLSSEWSTEQSESPSLWI